MRFRICKGGRSRIPRLWPPRQPPPTSLLAQGEVDPDVEVRRFAVLQVEAEVAFVMPSSDSAIGSGGAGIASTSVTGLRKARGVLFVFAFPFLFPRRRRRSRRAAATGSAPESR